MGKRDPVQMGDSLTQQSLGGHVCCGLVGIAAAVDQKILPVTLQQNTLAFSHIHDRQADIIQLRNPDGQQDCSYQ